MLTDDLLAKRRKFFSDNELYRRINKVDASTKPRDRLIIGNTDPDGEGEEIFIPTKTSDGRKERITCLIIASPGQGKTKMLKSLVAQRYANGDNISVICDPKLEWSNINAPPEKNIKENNLPRGYLPMSIPVKTYLPEYCIHGRRFPYDVHRDMIFNYKLKNLEINDLKTLLNININKTDQQSENASWTLSSAWNAMRKKLGRMYDNRNVNDIQKSIMSLADMTDREQMGMSHRYTKAKLVGKFEHLKGEKVFGDKGLDHINNVNNRIIPILSNKYSKNYQYDKVYASIFMRQLFDARNENLIKNNMWFFLDEFQIIGQRGSSALDVLMELIIRQGRAKMMNVIVATQTFNASGNWENQVPKEIIGMFDHIITYKLSSEADLKMICNAKHIRYYDNDYRVIENLEINKEKNIVEAAWINRDSKVTTFFPYWSTLLPHSYEGDN